MVEGEKCVDILWKRFKIPAVTSSHGNGSAKKTEWSPLGRFRVVLNPDNDEAGEKDIEAVAGILGALATPPEVKVVRFANLPPGGDVEQHLENCAGFDDVAIREDLERLVNEAPVMERPTEPRIEAVTLEDIQNLLGDGTRFLCRDFMIRNHLNVLGAKEKTGKTHVGLDLLPQVLRRSRVAERGARDVPEGHPFPLGPRRPASRRDHGAGRGDGTAAFGVHAQRGEGRRIRRDQSRRRGEPGAPFEKLCREYRPGLVVIDTVGGCTNRKMHIVDDAQAFFHPIIDIAKKCGVTILAITHLNKEGDFLSLRIKGIARASGSSPPRTPRKSNVAVSKSPATSGSPSPWASPSTTEAATTTGILRTTSRPTSRAAPVARGPKPKRSQEIMAWILERLQETSPLVASDLQQDGEERSRLPQGHLLEGRRQAGGQ